MASTDLPGSSWALRSSEWYRVRQHRGLWPILESKALPRKPHLTEPLTCQTHTALRHGLVSLIAFHKGTL